MSQAVHTAVDAYFNEKLTRSDATLNNALARQSAEGLPAIAVAPNQGKMIHLFARMAGARRMLEIGTLGGYSTIWLARALPDDGQLVTLELEPHHADVARTNLDDAGLLDRVEIVVGRAADSLKALADRGEPPFDFIFIDADKPSTAIYLEAALPLARTGTTIVIDNVVRDGKVVDPDSTDPNVIGVRAGIEAVAANPRLSATGLQTVGSKGYDGFVLAIVEAE